MEQTLIKPIWKWQITIPWAWRKSMGINKDTYVRATFTSNWVLLQNAKIDLNEKNNEKIFDEAINEAFVDLWKSWKLKSLSDVLSEKY